MSVQAHFDQAKADLHDEAAWKHPVLGKRQARQVLQSLERAQAEAKAEGREFSNEEFAQAREIYLALEGRVEAEPAEEPVAPLSEQERAELEQLLKEAQDEAQSE